MMNSTLLIQFFSVCWAQLQEQGPAEERTTTLTPVLTYSSAFSAVRCDVRSKSAECLFQLQFQPALAHHFYLFLTHPVELMPVLAHACARIMHVCTRAHAVYPRFAFLFWQFFPPNRLIIYTDIVEHDFFFFFSCNHQVKVGTCLSFRLTDHRHYSVHTCLHQVVKEFECFQRLCKLFGCYVVGRDD